MTIDIHSHIYPREYLDLLAGRDTVPYVQKKSDGEHFVIFADEERELGATRPMTPDFYDIGAKLAFMDRSGIDQSVISLGNPWLDFLPPEDAIRWAAHFNNWLQSQCEDQPRLEAFGVIAPHAPNESAREIERLAGMSHIHGVILGTRPHGAHLDSPEMEPVWEALERTGTLVFLHPHYVVGYDWLGGYGHALPLALGFTFETTTAISRLILSGTLDRFPKLRILLAHGGGVLPYLAGRLSTCVSVDPVASRHIDHPIAEYLQRLYYDAVVYSSEVLSLTLATAGPHQIAFGTDHPFGIANPDLIRTAISEASPSQQVQQSLLGENALRMIASDHGSTPKL